MKRRIVCAASALLVGFGSTLGPTTSKAEDVRTVAAVVTVDDVVHSDGAVGQDNMPDLIVQDTGAATMRILPQQPDGTFGLEPDHNPAYVISSGLVAPSTQYTGDFNQDGRQDVVVSANGSLDAAVFVNKGDGTVCPGDTSPGPYCAPTYWSLGGGLVSGDNKAIDVNSDGVPDILSANMGTNDVSVLLAHTDAHGRWDGTFAPAYRIPVNGLGPSAILSGDFHGATDPSKAHVDIVTANTTSSSISLMYNDGRGHFTVRQTLSVLPQSAGLIVINVHELGADFNHDGYPDVIASDAGSLTTAGDMTIALGGADGLLHLGQRIPFPGGGVFYPGLADVDRDGNVDVIAGNQLGQLSIFRGHGDGTFDTKPFGTYQVGGGVWLAFGTYLSSYDRAHHIVSIITSANEGAGHIWVLHGNGDGTFQAPQEY